MVFYILVNCFLNKLLPKLTNGLLITANCSQLTAYSLQYISNRLLLKDY